MIALNYLPFFLIRELLMFKFIRCLFLKSFQKYTYKLQVTSSGVNSRLCQERNNLINALIYSFLNFFDIKKNNHQKRKLIQEILCYFISNEYNPKWKKFKKQYGFRQPIFLLLGITKKCNLKCSGCFTICNEDKEDSLDWKTVTRVMNEKQRRRKIRRHFF